VALVARRRDRVAKVAESITHHRGMALVLEADLADPDQAHEAITRAARELGRVDDMVVDNAALLDPGPVADAPAGECGQMIAIVSGGSGEIR